MQSLPDNLIMAEFRAPQKENGYTAIANELLEALYEHDFSKRELCVLLAVIRMTYGYNRKEDALSGWQIAEMAGMDDSNVRKTMQELIRNNVIYQSEKGRYTHGQEVKFIGINKHYHQWLTVDKTTRVTRVKTTLVNEIEPGSKQPVSRVKTTRVTRVKTTREPGSKQPAHKDNLNTIKDSIKDICANAQKIDSAFAQFWEAYPRKTDKKKALLAFKKISPNATLLQTMLQAITNWKNSGEWDEARFIPHPTTWLNGARWQDELPSLSYSADELAVFDAYNAVMPDAGWPLAHAQPYIATRAAGIRGFLKCSSKPNWLAVYFGRLAETEKPFDDAGFDWAIRVETFAKVKEGAIRERA